MKEVAKEFELCEFGLDPTVKGFEPEGIFLAHLKSIRHSNLPKKFTPQEIEENTGCPETVVSSNM